MATFTNKELAKTTLNTVLSTVYTAPALTTTILTALTLCNSAGGGTARLVQVQMGGKNVLNAYSLADTETIVLTAPHVLSAGQTIAATQTVGTDVDLIASGVEVT